MSVELNAIVEDVNLLIRKNAVNKIVEACEYRRKHEYFFSAHCLEDAISQLNKISVLDANTFNTITDCYNDLAASWLHNNDTDSCINVWWEAIRWTQSLIAENQSFMQKINLFIAKAYSNLAYLYMEYAGYHMEVLGSLINAVTLYESCEETERSMILSFYKEIVEQFIPLDKDDYILFYSTRFLNVFYNHSKVDEDVEEIAEDFFSTFADVILSYVRNNSRKNKLSLLICQFPKIIEELYEINELAAAIECCLLIKLTYTSQQTSLTHDHKNGIKLNDFKIASNDLDYAQRYLVKIYSLYSKPEVIAYPVNSSSVLFAAKKNLSAGQAQPLQENTHLTTASNASCTQTILKIV